jgi:hypothetical protein
MSAGNNRKNPSRNAVTTAQVRFEICVDFVVNMAVLLIIVLLSWSKSLSTP